MTEYIEVLKLRKLSQQKSIDNNEKHYAESHTMNMRDDKDSYERDQIGRNDEEKVPDVKEVLRLQNFEFAEKYRQC